MVQTIPCHSGRQSPRGMTLLEVLISCGVLAVGLASIASLLPAAGSRLGQAATEDRAGTLAANARADAAARGLLAFDLFADPAKSIGFGTGMTTLPAINAAQFAAPAATLSQRIDPQRGFLLEDEVEYAPSSAAASPANAFSNGHRAFKEALRWGATLVPNAFPARVGAAAVLSVAVFRKDGLAEAVPLTTMPGDLYRMTTANENMLKRLLKSCSYVLVRSATPGQGPRWFRIAASWRPPVNPATGLRQNDGCYVIFANPGFGAFAGINPTVIGFENLVRVDQYNVILE
jgi:type II secretory pathway pseudopilin PulG